ncbi:MAG: pyridoxal phosphate-dependent aminotransferase [Gammaproteobacteria bacterium]|nr:pyridoxal phosphate-dependent aminotransferase [Gammaproteobacteria bacterium]
MGKEPLNFAERMGEIAPFRVMELLARAKKLEAEGRSIIHMEVGEPDFSTPEPIIAAAQAALTEGKTHYTPATGLPELRQAISDFYRQRYGEEVSPEQIVITSGASAALLLALGIILDPGSEVVMADPGYPCNRHFVRFIEGKARTIPVTSENSYQLNADLVDQNWRDETRAVMVASPSNPTGTIISQDELKAIYDKVVQHRGYLIVDEIYHNLTYGEQPPSAVNLGERAIIINSFSKYFSMTGWRLGWLVASREVVAEIDKLAQNLFIAAPTLAQYAALAAFNPETIEALEQRRVTFQQRRDYLLPELQQLGFKISGSPQGAFYLYADCTSWGMGSTELADRLLGEVGVAITPGNDFGDFREEEHVRIAYTTSLEKLKEAVRRIAQFRASLGLSN